MCDIVPAALAVKSMRDNGYKNAAYAIAELIDNSIQANAKHVDFLIGERFHNGNRQTSSLEKIAILDNGEGMSLETLQIALQFGNGTHLDRENQNGIGKFGMGLPSASISQCRRVEVYTWQDGINSAIWTYIDIDEITNGEMTSIPRPTRKNIPQEWNRLSKNFGNSGTLILWTKIDKCHWKKGNTIIKHSESLIGRIYRKFLQEESVKIRMVTYDVEGNQPKNEYLAKPNDPLYLMTHTSCPERWSTEPMFEIWGEEPSIHEIEFRGEIHKVKITYSIAKQDARSMPNAGAQPHGRHAKKNIGVSIVRSQREIILDPRWAIQYDPVERWWGIEVDFPPGLDDVFGLTNNKQSVSTFEDLAIENLKDLEAEGLELSKYKRELEDNDDPAASLLDIVAEIANNLKLMRRKIKAQTQGQRQRREAPTRSAEVVATAATIDRQDDGHEGSSDSAAQESPAERQQILEAGFIDDGYSEEDARQIAAALIDNGSKYRFETKALETSSFFTVSPLAGIIYIYINSDHPAYSHLIELITYTPNDNQTIEQLTNRLSRAKDSLFLILAAWARYEDEQISTSVRDRLKDIRSDWGRIARDFLRCDE